ncbi:MAG: lysylphosphatidylglycerol synthase domain-containing protein [Sandaracinaceae bacterium]
MAAADGGRRARLWVLVRALLGVVGVGVAVYIVRDVGIDALQRAIVPALPWLPLAIALELARIAMDAVSTRSTLASRGEAVPWPALFGSHLVAFAVMGVAPAGRATAEAVKASLLARWIGAPTAAAMGTANQANTLLSSGTFSLLSALAAYLVSGPSTLTALLVVHTVMMNASGLALRVAARYRKLQAWLQRRFPKLAREIDTFGDASRETALYPAWPVASMMIGRAFQAAHFGVLAVAVGLSPSVLAALALHGVYLVVAALGVMIPGQLGASEWGFVMAAETLGTTEARAAAIALLAHAIQLILVAVGFVLLALWPERRKAPIDG